MNAPNDKPIVLPRHGVKFYSSDESLFSTVAAFLAQGLVTGQPAVAFATEAHRAGIVEFLGKRFVDVDRATATGNLLFLDARETLETFMVDGMPDEARFELHVGGVLGRVVQIRPDAIVRAYGEMVNLLWQDNQSGAAIRLEMLWNQLAARHGFALLCGYSMGPFFKEAVHFEAVCAQHAEVLQDERVALFPVDGAGHPGRAKRST